LGVEMIHGLLCTLTKQGKVKPSFYFGRW